MKLFKLLLKGVAILGILVGAIIIYGLLMNYKNTAIDLTKSESWLEFPGATLVPGGIRFLPQNSVIVHQDGSQGQPNPPVHVTGPHLLVTGDFKITAVASHIDQQASLRLYAWPPVIYDQWRAESPSIETVIDTVNNTVTVRIWDGNASNSMDIRIYKTILNSTTTISLEHIKNHINIVADNSLLGSMPDHNIFKNGTIWFGMDGAPKSTGWTLSALYVEPINNGKIEVVASPSMLVDQTDPNSLRNLADNHPRHIKIGTAVSLNPLFTNEQYKKIALGQFSIITPENSMKPQFIHPQPDVYAFEEADQLVDAALKNNILINGHALVYDKSTPEWMTKIPKLKRQEVLIAHIEKVVTHFKGRVAQWDVVNEPFSKKNALYKKGGTGLEPNIWFEAMGEEYIDLAFRTARNADPSAKLYLNDYGLENDGQHWDAFFALVKRLKARQVPIDGVGFEAHVYGDGDYINPDQLRNHMRSLEKLGLLVRISEIDVTQDDAKEQVNQYSLALDVCLRQKNCTAYSTWGITDLYGSTTRSDRYPTVYGTSLLWDTDFKPKPAYKALQTRLQQPF